MTAGADPAPAPGRTVYFDYIAAELDVQNARKASLEQRGLAVITTAGALVSLLFGLVAVITGTQNYTLPSSARPWLYVALVLFVLAAVGALLTNAPLVYSTVKADALKAAVRTRWEDLEPEAQRMVALTRLKVIADTKKKNDWKGWLLLASMLAEVGAVASVAVAVRDVLTG